MGFIDQIMGAMGMEAARTVTEEPTSNADPQRTEETKTCLLYTSDAADEL